jgi:glycosyltransferase involved in cell wall biosynthesis
MKKSLFIIPGYRLFPIETGAGVAQFGFIDSLRHEWKISLLVDDSNVLPEHVAQLRLQWDNVELLFWKDLRQAWEDYVSSSLSYKVRRKFSSRTQVESFPNLPIPEQLRDVWENVSILYFEWPEWRRASLAFYLKKRHFDIVQTDLPCNLTFGSSVPRSTKSVHVCHELKHKRFESSAHLLGVSGLQYEKLLSALKKKELELLKSFDYCLCFSAEDKDAIDPDSDAVIISPFPVLDQEFHAGNRAEPIRLLFLGPEHHGPNKEGLVWFLKTVWNHTDSKMKLHVVGAWTDETIAELTQDNVCFEGFVEELSPFFEDSIMIVPILSGAGIRTKILQAMAQKVPVLSTRFGAQGMSVEDDMHLGFFDDLKEFEAKLKFMHDRERRERMTMQAQAYVKGHFSQSVLSSIRSKLFHSILDSK